MYISEIEFKNYRNLKNGKVSLTKGLNILLGPNASGKTNFLELFYLLSNGKLFRQGDVKNVIKDTHEVTHINSKLEKNNFVNSIKFGISKTTKKLVFNGKVTSTTKAKINFPVVLFSPESLSTIKNSDSERRELIDELVFSCYPNHIDTFYNFQKILKHKQKLIRDNLNQKTKSPHFSTVLKAINIKFLPLAAEVTHLRLKAIKLIESHWQDAVKNIFANTSDVDTSVDYIISEQRVNDWNYEQLFNAMYNRLKELEGFEVSSGKILVGPQRHDITFKLNGKNARYFGSQGQQRSLIIAFKMAQVKLHYLTLGYYPMLLLDDVLSELDEFKRERLIYFLKTINSQVVLTTTEIEKPLETSMGNSQTLRIKNGEFFEQEVNKLGAISV